MSPGSFASTFSYSSSSSFSPPHRYPPHLPPLLRASSIAKSSCNLASQTSTMVGVSVPEAEATAGTAGATASTAGVAAAVGWVIGVAEGIIAPLYVLYTGIRFLLSGCQEARQILQWNSAKCLLSFCQNEADLRHRARLSHPSCSRFSFVIVQQHHKLQIILVTIH